MHDLIGLGSKIMFLLKAVFLFVRGILSEKAGIAIENLALRQQLAVLHKNIARPRIRNRDRDSTYGEFFSRRIKHMGIEEITIAARSPWQTPYVERMIGSIRRECLDHMIILNDNHLRRILSSYLDYYHHSRTHQSLDRNSPCPREVDPPEGGKVVAIPKVGGLHNHYRRAA